MGFRKPRSLTIVPAFLLASTLAHASEPSKPVPARIEASAQPIKDQLKAAADAYYADQMTAALDQLSQLTGRLDALKDQHVPAGVRASLHLWRVAVFLAQNDAEHAASEARQALELDPDRSADLSVFPPAVATLLDQERAKLTSATNVMVKVLGAPAGSILAVDDHPLATDHVSLPPGRHWISVQAPGFRYLDRSFDTAREQTLDLRRMLQPLVIARKTVPMTKKPLFWVVAGGAVAVLAGGAAAAASSGTTTKPHEQDSGLPPGSTIEWP